MTHQQAVLAMLQMAVPLVPMVAWRCPHCDRPAERYDGQDVCERCVMESFAEHG